MYRKGFYIYSLFGYAILMAILSSCHEQVSSGTIVTLTASKNALERSNDDLDGSCRRFVKMLEADKKNHPEHMTKLLSMDSMLNAYANPLDTLLIKLIGDIHYSEKMPEENVDKDFLHEIENGALFKRKLGVIKNVVNVLVTEFPLPDTVLPIDRYLINGKFANMELFSHTVSKLEAATMLTVLRNNIKSTQAVILKRFVKEIYEEDWLSRDELFINCNYSHLKIGDTLRASFGIGEIGYMNVCDIFIDGKLVPPTKQKMLRPIVPFGSKDPTIQIEAINTIYTEIIRKPGRYVRPVLVQIPTRSGGINEIRDSLVYSVDP
jgi:hypothetical protein